MKHVIFTVLLSCFCLSGWAQQSKKFDPKDFQRRFETFTSEKAGFTKEEATKFFALYTEMQGKMRSFYRQYNDILKNTADDAEDKTMTAAVNRMNELDLAETKLKTEYLKKFRKVISDRKYLLFKKAETRFRSHELRQHQGGNRRKEKPNPQD